MLTVRTIPFLAALACGGVLSTAAHAQFGTMPGQGTRFSSVGTGSQSKIDRAGLYRFLDEATLRNHWSRFGLGGQFPPKVNWTTDQVVVIHLGPRSSGGYSVSLAGMERLPTGRVRILAVESTPLKGQITTDALTSPYLALAIDRTIPGFELSWTKREGNGLLPPGAQLPPGSTVFTYPGNVTVVSPLIGPWDVYGGDYYSYCPSADSFWISGDADLVRYNQRYLGNPHAIAPAFDWRSERLFAVHLGTRVQPVGIETVSFEQKDGRGVLKLRETRAGAMNPRPGTPVSPFLLVRVSRQVRSMDVEWVKTR